MKNFIFFFFIITFLACAFCKNESETNNFAGMEKSEIVFRLTSVFNLFDTDKNGILDLNEMKLATLKITSINSQKQGNLELKAIDTNNDGLISFEELKAAYMADEEDDSPEAESGLKARFDIVDLNHDNFLNSKEISDLINPTNNPELIKLEIDFVFKTQDLDQDGNISMEEFMKAHSNDNLSEDDKSQMLEEFSLYDTNSNGFIDKEEIFQVIMSLPKETMEELNNLSELGQNGAVTLDVVLSNIEKFSVSPLTDNGEILRLPENYELDLPFKNIEMKVNEHDEL